MTGQSVQLALVQQWRADTEMRSRYLDLIRLFISVGRRAEFALSNLGSLLIVGVRNSVRPSHLFDPNRNHDYVFELPMNESSAAQPDCALIATELLI
jgi:hypothetical protein